MDGRKKHCPVSHLKTPQKGIQIRKEAVILSLFANDMMLYKHLNIPKTVRINGLSQAAEYKINRQKSAEFLYTNHGLSKRIKKTIPFINTMALKKIKYLGISFTKRIKKPAY